MHFNDWSRRGRCESKGGAPNGRPRGDNASNGDGEGSGGSALSSIEREGGGVNGMASGEAGQRLLSGREWYTQDVFLALNQVVPSSPHPEYKKRCIKTQSGLLCICVVRCLVLAVLYKPPFALVGNLVAFPAHFIFGNPTPSDICRCVDLRGEMSHSAVVR